MTLQELQRAIAQFRRRFGCSPETFTPQNMSECEFLANFIYDRSDRDFSSRPVSRAEAVHMIFEGGLQLLGMRLVVPDRIERRLPHRHSMVFRAGRHSADFSYLMASTGGSNVWDW